ncbi:hypothetical protein A6769_28040 [Nostoc punctiforme NIES-2108]|uniref:Magnesium transporter MgtE intracellular domain-containing protein n=1 Tax=Nostoc punctiforme NIES-2108 TaxID=1356359 RepID=A0A367R7K9_NOSPU|nr:hypothetical protein A6769_28040 [Nostoc punctiforme NIES-2108]
MPAVFSKNRSSPEMGNTIKELLSTLTIDEQLGMILELEDLDPDKFAQLVTDAPELNGWM